MKVINLSLAIRHFYNFDMPVLTKRKNSTSTIITGYDNYLQDKKGKAAMDMMHMDEWRTGIQAGQYWETKASVYREMETFTIDYKLSPLHATKVRGH